jgi:hypothetical protein
MILTVATIWPASTGWNGVTVASVTASSSRFSARTSPASTSTTPAAAA